MHIPTLSLAIVLVSATLALVVGLMAERGRRDGMHAWALGLMTQALAYGLVALRDRVGEGLAVVLGATLQSAALALLGESLHQFYASRTRRLALWMPVMATFVNCSLLLHVLPLRIWVNAALFAVQIALLLELLLRHWSATGGRGRYLLFASWAIVLPLLLARGVVAGFCDDAMADLGAPSPMQGLSLALVLCAALVGTLGFVLMSMERADCQMRQMAMHDELTGLASRRSTLEALEQQVAMACRSGQALTLLMLDIDHFKRVNDQFGHLAGDAALRHVANTLRARFRRQDLLGRFGGEEFLAILPATSAAGGGQVLAETVRDALAATPVLVAGETELCLTVSVGVAEVALDGATNSQAVIRAADLALYRAKLAGRNRVELAQQADYAAGPGQRMRMPGTAPGQGSIT